MLPRNFMPTKLLVASCITRCCAGWSPDWGTVPAAVATTATGGGAVLGEEKVAGAQVVRLHAPQVDPVFAEPHHGVPLPRTDV